MDSSKNRKGDGDDGAHNHRQLPQQQQVVEPIIIDDSDEEIEEEAKNFFRADTPVLVFDSDEENDVANLEAIVISSDDENSEFTDDDSNDSSNGPNNIGSDDFECHEAETDVEDCVDADCIIESDRNTLGVTNDPLPGDVDAEGFIPADCIIGDELDLENYMYYLHAMERKKMGNTLPQHTFHTQTPSGIQGKVSKGEFLRRFGFPKELSPPLEDIERHIKILCQVLPEEAQEGLSIILSVSDVPPGEDSYYIEGRNIPPARQNEPSTSTSEYNVKPEGKPSTSSSGLSQNELVRAVNLHKKQTPNPSTSEPRYIGTESRPSTSTLTQDEAMKFYNLRRVHKSTSSTSKHEHLLKTTPSTLSSSNLHGLQEPRASTSKQDYVITESKPSTSSSGRSQNELVTDEHQHKKQRLSSSTSELQHIGTKSRPSTSSVFTQDKAMKVYNLRSVHKSTSSTSKDEHLFKTTPSTLSSSSPSTSSSGRSQNELVTDVHQHKKQRLSSSTSEPQHTGTKSRPSTSSVFTQHEAMKICNLRRVHKSTSSTSKDEYLFKTTPSTLSSSHRLQVLLQNPCGLDNIEETISPVTRDHGTTVHKLTSENQWQNRPSNSSFVFGEDDLPKVEPVHPGPHRYHPEVTNVTGVLADHSYCKIRSPRCCSSDICQKPTDVRMTNTDEQPSAQIEAVTPPCEQIQPDQHESELIPQQTFSFDDFYDEDLDVDVYLRHLEQFQSFDISEVARLVTDYISNPQPSTPDSSPNQEET